MRRGCRRSACDGSSSCSSDDSSSSDCSSDSDEGCCARPISAWSQANKFVTCRRLAKKIPKQGAVATAAQTAFAADVIVKWPIILEITGEDSLLTAGDIKAIRKKQIRVCVGILVGIDIVRRTLRNKKDIDEAIGLIRSGIPQEGMLARHWLILNDRTYCAYKQVKRMQAKRLDEFGDPQPADEEAGAEEEY